MKTQYLLIQLLFGTLCYSQTPDSTSYYPHSSNNIWQYYDYLCVVNGDTTQQYIIFDSTDYEGKYYIIIRDSLCRGDIYYIFSGDSVVYECDNQSFNNPKILYKFNAPKRSQWVYERLPSGDYVMIQMWDTYYDCWLGKCDSIKVFIQKLVGDTLNDTTGLVYMELYLMKGLGLFWTEEEALGTGRVLMGAKINNHIYGTITNIKYNRQHYVKKKYFDLYQNYPNPFNPFTTIRYDLFSNCHVKINVYNSLGQIVISLVDQNKEMGHHEVIFDGHNLASGIYIYKLQIGEFIQSRKMILLK